MFEMTIPSFALTPLYYYLSCAESLLGNVEEAIIALEKTIDLGFNDMNRLKSDKLLKNIQCTEGYKRLIEKLENILGDPLKEKLDLIQQRIRECIRIPMNLPRSFLQDMLILCEGDVEGTIQLINSTMFV